MSITPGDYLKLKPLRTGEQSENFKKYILFGSIILGIAAVILIQELRSPAAETDRFSAYSAAQEILTETLKQPAADFQSVNRAGIKEIENNIWEIKAYFDSKESSGRTVRTFFTIRIQFEGREWTLKHLRLDGKKNL